MRTRSLLLPSSSSWATTTVGFLLVGSSIQTVVDGFSSPAVMMANARPLHLPAAPPTTSRRSSLATLFCPALHISASPQDEQDNLQRDAPENNNNNNNEDGSVRRGLRRLAQLSLEDYDWRMSLFKEKEADRKVEEYLAGMVGEDASYVRPMDASDTKIGPLGRAEKAAVDWLSDVIDEEGRRAKKIVNTDGQLVRPIDAGDGTGDLGPLGMLEKNFVEFLNLIRSSEKQRVKEGVWRPKDLDESNRGPLGQLELSVVSALRNIQEAEVLRAQQSRIRGGEMVRPIDVPGPLGEFELAVADVIQSERLRARDGKEQEGIVRPKDALVRGKLGEYEMQAVEAVRQLTEEERNRLRNIQRRLQDNRPMDIAQNSMLGILEAILVGMIRAPALLLGVFQRVLELLNSEGLGEKDKVILESRLTEESASSESGRKSD